MFNLLSIVNCVGKKDVVSSKLDLDWRQDRTVSGPSSDQGSFRLNTVQSAHSVHYTLYTPRLVVDHGNLCHQTYTGWGERSVVRTTDC